MRNGRCLDEEIAGSSFCALDIDPACAAQAFGGFIGVAHQEEEIKNAGWDVVSSDSVLQPEQAGDFVSAQDLARFESRWWH